MKKFNNPKKEKFINSIPTASLDLPSDTLTKRMKFNFSYLDTSQDGTFRYADLNEHQKTILLNKLTEYSRESVGYWQQQKIGSGKHRRSVLSVYGRFPQKSKFIHPANVPHQVMWARFRIDQETRIGGFIIPDSYHGMVHKSTGMIFDKNTFYVVFLDYNHSFYLTSK